LKNSPGQIRWQYILTSEGMKEKIKITKNYLERRLFEFENLQKEINQLQSEVNKDAND